MRGNKIFKLSLYGRNVLYENIYHKPKRDPNNKNKLNLSLTDTMRSSGVVVLCVDL